MVRGFLLIDRVSKSFLTKFNCDFSGRHTTNTHVLISNRPFLKQRRPFIPHYFHERSLITSIPRKIKMSDDESKIPDRDTCQKLTEDFAKITKTNEALAQTFLQDHEWDLNRSVSAFYEALSAETKNSEEDKPEGGNNSADLYNPATVQKLFGEGKAVTTEPPPRMIFLSWNLDGLDEKNLKRRTRSVKDTILKLEPDIVFFQEVIQETADYLESKLPEYKCIRGGNENYFTMTMLRVFTIFYDKHTIVEYPHTDMGRNLLVTEAHMGKLKLQLLNTHLESMAEHSGTRCQQLKTAFDLCQKFSDDYTIIFGGDLNMRDKEAEIPVNFYDIWEYCGSPAQYRYTWDMQKNTNLPTPGKFKPRCRFDRVYTRFSRPKRAKPKHFALTGFEKVPKTQSFPSDHWGIVVLFDLDHSDKS